ncbi:OmpA family protein [Oscillatoria amoena NRMC-F 0135]|nr:OmpA family protein [Oscillatoria amoena NRMC-F 0135]
MKTLRNMVLGAMMLSICTPELAQGNDFQGHHYVVIGAFAIKKNAVRFTSKASSGDFQAKYEMNPDRKLYYVYVLTTDDRNKAIELALKLRRESPYDDTWVFNGLLGENQAIAIPGVDINPTTPDQVVQVASNDSEFAARDNTGTSVRQVIFEEVTAADKQQPELSTNEDLSGKNFFFKVYRADTKESIQGDINAVDSERSKKVGSYEANRQIRVTNPNSKSGNLLLITEVFGYRKVQRELNYLHPEAEDIGTDADNNVVVPFELTRLQKGDIAVMYNVYFFKDAAVMRPESRWEVNSLLNMLNENPKYKIKIHGHTNGNAPGRIISKSDKSDNFFALTDTRDGFGSAKKLSQERAEVIKSYLVANGIDTKRMQVKAWGGKKPVVDKLHNQAENNVRVEIEILEN